MSDKSTLRLIGEHLTRALAPLQRSVADLDSFTSFMVRLGWDVKSLPADYGPLGTDIVTAVGQLEGLADDPTPGEIDALLARLKGLYVRARSLSAPDGVHAPTFAQEIGLRLFELLLVEYLNETFPRLYHALTFFGIIEFAAVDSDESVTPPRPPFLATRVHYSRIPRWLGNPGLIAPELFGWGTDHLQFQKLADVIVALLTAAGRTASIGRADQTVADGFQRNALAPRGPIGSMVRAVLMDGVVDNNPVEVAVDIFELPAETGQKPGIVVQPRIPLSRTIEFGANLALVLRGPEVQQPFGLLIRPNEEDAELRFPFDTGTGSRTLFAVLEFKPDGETTLFGRPKGTRLSVRGASLGVHLDQTGDKLAVAASFAPRALALSVKAGDADGFIGTLLESIKLRASFDLEARWSSRTGFTLSGSGGFEREFVLNLTIGPLLVQRLIVAVRGAVGTGAAQALKVEIGAQLLAQLGPLRISAEGLGVDLSLIFADGNAGPYQTSVGFLAPNGVGVVVEAGPVRGGGFFGHKDGRYSGALELKIYSVTVKAFGVIDTKLPDGSRGFSFVIVISAEFTPIQLGLGFTLNGVGGIVGINRSFDEKGLSKALDDGSLENILFPRNVTERAPEIIGALSSILPPVESKYVFGPMAKLGWGTPTLINAKIGVVLELPGPLVTILGVLNCALPKPDKAIVELNMGVVGRLDFPNKSLAIDAKLGKSHVGPYPVYGGMAMRLRWGERPLFALAIGGFHPSFQPPPDFPQLERLRADIGNNGNPAIEVSGFFAITSNTVQIGGAITLHASGSGISLDAELAIKALFVFSPFQFEADISAKVRVSFRGHGIGVHLHAVLNGPSPWRLRGEICVSILWWDACVSLNKTFGSGEKVEVPAIDPWAGSAEITGLRAALQDPRSWSPLPPPRAFQVVSLAEPSAGSDTVPLDPMGEARVHERVLPLETKNGKITRFGAAPSTGPDRFALTKATFGTTTISDLRFASDVSDFFAPAQYFELTAAQKLSAPSFQQYTAGYTFSVPETAAPAVGSSGHADVTFETFVRDQRPGTPAEGAGPEFPLPASHLEGLSLRGASELGGLGQAGTEKFIGVRFKTLFEHVESLFQITEKATLKSAAVLSAPTSQWEALLALADHIEANPTRAGKLQVTALHEMGRS